MTGQPTANDPRGAFTDEQLAMIGEHVSALRPWVSEERFLRWSLGIGFVLGLAAHVGGYLLRTAVTAEPLLLIADLLYALGWSLWTGVVVAFLVQIFPEAKRRQLKRALEAYDAAVRNGARAGTPRRGAG
jgi:hypothetical protein